MCEYENSMALDWYWHDFEDRKYRKADEEIEPDYSKVDEEWMKKGEEE